MKLKRIGYNQTVVNHNNDVEVFFSYDTPVAGYSPELGYVRTQQWYSSTTSRHINKYLGVNTGSGVNYTNVSQDVINNLASNLPTNITSTEHN